MKGIHEVRAGITRVLGIVIICLLAIMTVVGTYQIVTRYFFSRPNTVSGGLLTHSFTWMVLLASAYIFGKGDYMYVGFPVDKTTGSARRRLEIAIDLLTFAFVGVAMMYGSISITKLIVIQITASLRVSVGYICVTMSMTGLFIILSNLMNTAGTMYRDFSGREEA